MGKQDIKANFKDVLDIVTTTVASTISQSSQSYSNSTIVVQDNEGTSNCTNSVWMRNKTLYYASSDIFNTTSVYQNAIISIVQQLSDTQSSKATGGIFSNQDEQFYATIMDMLQTRLTATTLVDIGNNSNNVTVYVQKCSGATNSGNIIISSQKNIFKYYNSVYNQNATVQSVCADISNYITGVQKQKKTGFLVVLIRMIALIIIGVVILAIVIVGAYLITLKGG